MTTPEISVPVAHGMLATEMPRDGFALSAMEHDKSQIHDLIETMSWEEFCAYYTVPVVLIVSRISPSDGADAKERDSTVECFPVTLHVEALFKCTSQKISHSEKCGLVLGLNQKVKSTLLKLLARSKIPLPEKMYLLLVEQEMAGDEKTALEAVVSADKELVDARREVDMLTGAEDEEDEIDDKGGRLAALYDKLEAMGSDAAEAHATKILSGLGFRKDMRQRQTKFLDSSWRRKISLARALFLQPTLHTDHHDISTVLSIKDCLRTWKKNLAVLSFDQDFLMGVHKLIIE